MHERPRSSAARTRPTPESLHGPPVDGTFAASDRNSATDSCALRRAGARPGDACRASERGLSRDDVMLAPVSLLSLPDEILQRIAQCLPDPRDLWRLATTCSRLARVVCARGCCAFITLLCGPWIDDVAVIQRLAQMSMMAYHQRPSPIISEIEVTISVRLVTRTRGITCWRTTCCAARHTSPPCAALAMPSTWCRA